MNKQNCRSFIFLPFWNWLEILIYWTDRLSWNGGRNPSRSLSHCHFCCFYVWILCLSLLQINCDDDRCFWLVKLCELCIPLYAWYFWSCMTVEFSYQWDYSFLVALVLWWYYGLLRLTFGLPFWDCDVLWASIVSNVGNNWSS